MKKWYHSRSVHKLLYYNSVSQSLQNKKSETTGRNFTNLLVFLCHCVHNNLQKKCKFNEQTCPLCTFVIWTTLLKSSITKWYLPKTKCCRESSHVTLNIFLPHLKGVEAFSVFTWTQREPGVPKDLTKHSSFFQVKQVLG